MFAIELYMLKEYCKLHGIDYQEIDESLTYREVITHLETLVIKEPSEVLEAHAKQFKILEEQYRDQLFKEYAQHSQELDAPILEVIASFPRTSRIILLNFSEAHPFTLAVLHHYCVFYGTSQEINNALNKLAVPIRFMQTRCLNPPTSLAPSIIVKPEPIAKDNKLMKAFKGDKQTMAKERWRGQIRDRYGYEHHKLDAFDIQVANSIR